MKKTVFTLPVATKARDGSLKQVPAIKTDEDVDQYDDQIGCVPLNISHVAFGEHKPITEHHSIERYWSTYLKEGRNGFVPVNMRPPYQRQIVWKTSKQKEFILSLFNSIAIAPIYLNRYRNGEGRWAYDMLDGQQRSTAIKNFMENRFTIPVQIEGEQRLKKWAWQQIKRSNALRDAVDQFLQFQITITRFDNLPLMQQREMFRILNSGVAINTDEKLYCYNFLARTVLENLYDRIFVRSNLTKFIPNKDKTRFREPKSMHQLLCLTCGPDFGEGPHGVSLKLQESSDSFDAKLVALEFESTDEVSPALLKSLKISDVVNTLEDLAPIVYEVFDKTLKTPKLASIVNARAICDVLAFFYALDYHKCETAASIGRNLEAATKWLVAFHKHKDDENYKMNTTDKKMVTAKLEAMRDLWVTHGKNAKAKKITF